MAQRVFWNYKDDDDTAEMSRWLLGILTPGVYRGFDFVPTINLTLNLQHVQSIPRVREDLTVSGNLGIIVTRQGCVIQEDAPLNIQVEQGHATDPRIDLIVVSHDYQDVEGGQPAIYSIITGVPAPTPEAPVLPNPLTDTEIGRVLIPAGTLALTDAGVLYTPALVPGNPGGSKTKIISTKADLNNFGVDGQYYFINSSSLNSPSTGSDYYLKVFNVDDDYCLQEAYTGGSQYKYLRKKINSVWTAWKRILDSDDYTALAGTGGIGAKVDKMTVSLDANTFRVSGHAFWDLNTPNAPNGNSFMVISTFFDLSNGIQLAEEQGTHRIWRRQIVQGAWGAWSHLPVNASETIAWDDLTTTGFYTKTNNFGSVNSPHPGQGYMHLMVLTGDASITQLAFNPTSSSLFIRVKYVNTWTAWQTVLTTDHYDLLNAAIADVQTALNNAVNGLQDSVDAVEADILTLFNTTNSLENDKAEQSSLNNTNTEVGLKANKAQPAFTNFALLNGATFAGGVPFPPSYMKDTLGFVHIRGELTIAMTGAPVTVAQLPEGSRPSGGFLYYHCSLNSPTYFITIKDTGELVANGGTGTFKFDLENIAPFLGQQ